MSKPTLALIPSGYKSGKVYSILPNDASGDFDFSRASEGTRVRKDGLIEEVADNVPRLDWLNSNCPSLKLEPQRTNLVLFSEQFSGSNWGSVNTTITVDQETAPNGTLTANKLQRTSTSASYRSHNISKSASAITYTTSVFIKKGSDDYFSMRAQGSYPSRVDIRFRFDTEEIYNTQSFSNFTLLDYGVDKYQNGWYRLHFIYTSDTHTNLSITFSPRATDGNIDSSDNSSTSFAYVWGAQTEVANYPTSYIKTEGSTVTRLADVCNNAGTSDLFNDAEGVLYAEISALADDGTNRILGISNGGDFNNSVLLRFSSASNRIQAQVRLGGVYQCSLNYDVTDATQFNKIAFKYKTNDFSLYVNGIERDTDTSGDVITGLDVLDFDISTTNEFYGKVKDVRYFDRALTDAELTELTT